MGLKPIAIFLSYYVIAMNGLRGWRSNRELCIFTL